MQITDRIHSIPAQPAFYTGPQSPNVFFVEDGGEAALIDSGFGDPESTRVRLGFLQERPGARLRYILLTHHHFDHSGGAAQLRDALGGDVALHPREERFLRDWQSDAPQDFEAPAGQKAVAEAVARLRRQAAEASPELLLNDGDTLRVGGLSIEVIHTPGHTLGSICLYLPEERALFTGDTALGLGTVVISPPPYGDMAAYLESLERLKTYDCALMLPGHGRAVQDVRAKLQELIEHRLEREQQVLRLLADGKRTPKEMLPAIYMELDRRIVPMALRQIEAHLAKLESEGRVKRSDGEWAPAG